MYTHTIKQRAVFFHFRITGNQQFISVKDRIRAGKEAQRLHTFTELAATCG